MPQRFLRPGITTSQRFNAITFAAQTFYVRLITLVDDFGRYDAEPPLLRSHAFPFGDPIGKAISSKALAEMCEQLSKSGLATFYKAPDGKKYVQLVRWNENARAAKSKFPAFDDTCEQMFSDVSKCSPPSSSSSSSSLHPRHSSNGSQANTSEPSDADWLRELGESTAYQGIDVPREYAKMGVWCKTARKQPSRRRFINWLNKVEKPLRMPEKRQQLDPAKINISPAFKEWAFAKYEKKRDDIASFKTWADVPDWMRVEWKRENIDPLSAVVAKSV